jgi:hypothetical protein
MRAYRGKLTSLVFVSGAFILLMPMATSAASSRVYVANKGCHGHAVRPSKIILACGDGEVWATNLRFSAYGGRTAWGSGTLHYVVCQPNCAQGHEKTAPMRIRLAGIVRCAGRRYYGRAKVVSPPLFSRRPWNIRPLGC